MSDIIVE